LQCDENMSTNHAWRLAAARMAPRQLGQRMRRLWRVAPHEAIGQHHEEERQLVPLPIQVARPTPQVTDDPQIGPDNTPRGAACRQDHRDQAHEVEHRDNRCRAITQVRGQRLRSYQGCSATIRIAGDDN